MALPAERLIDVEDDADQRQAVQVLILQRSSKSHLIFHRTEERQLDRIQAEGLANRFARHSAMAKRSQEWAEQKGWKLLAPQGYRSQTLTVVENPPTFDVSALNKFMAPKGIRLANGYGQLKGKTFRIAHMGEIQMSDLEALLGCIDEFTK